MRKTIPYWIGTKPADGKRWSGADHAAVLQDQSSIDSIRRLYNRYVQRWNDIELDQARSLSEHSHEVCGAKVVGAARMFVLKHDSTGEGEWVLEVKYVRGFTPYHPGWSCGKNPFRTNADIANVRLHWSGTGKDAFLNWLQTEQKTNAGQPECQEYKLPMR